MEANEQEVLVLAQIGDDHIRELLAQVGHGTDVDAEFLLMLREELSKSQNEKGDRTFESGPAAEGNEQPDERGPVWQLAMYTPPPAPSEHQRLLDEAVRVLPRTYLEEYRHMPSLLWIFHVLTARREPGLSQLFLTLCRDTFAPFTPEKAIDSDCEEGRMPASVLRDHLRVGARAVVGSEDGDAVPDDERALAAKVISLVGAEVGFPADLAQEMSEHLGEALCGPTRTVAAAEIDALVGFKPMEVRATLDSGRLGGGKSYRAQQEVVRRTVDMLIKKQMPRTLFATHTIRLSIQAYCEIKEKLRAALSDLGDEELSDIGLTRADLDAPGDQTLEALGVPASMQPPGNLYQLLMLHPGWTARYFDEGLGHICIIGEAMKDALELGYAAKTVCGDPEKDSEDICPHINSCILHRLHREKKQRPITVASTAYLPIGFGREDWTFDHVVVDEDPKSALSRSVATDVALLVDAARELRRRRYNKQSPSQAFSLQERVKGGEIEDDMPEADQTAVQLSKALVGAAANAASANSYIRRADMPSPIALSKLLRALTSASNKASHVARERFTAKAVENKDVNDKQHNILRQASEIVEAILGALAMTGSFLPGLRVTSRERNGDEIEHWRKSRPRSGAGKLAPRLVMLRGHQVRPIHTSMRGANFKVLSGTLVAETVNAWWADVEVLPAEVSPGPTNMATYTHMLVGGTVGALLSNRTRDRDKDHALTLTGRRLAELIYERLKGHAGRRALIAGVAEIVRLLELEIKRLQEERGDEIATVTISTFDGLTGLNSYDEAAGFSFYAAICRTLPSFEQFHLAVEALAGRCIERPWTLTTQGSNMDFWQHVPVTMITRSGVSYQTMLPTHPDPRAEAILQEKVLAGPIQADRSRATRRQHVPAEILVCNSLAMPFAFDVVATRLHQIDGGEILQAAAEWGVVPDPTGSGDGWRSLVAMLRGVDDPYGAGADAMRKRRTYLSPAPEVQVSQALAGFVHAQKMSIFVRWPGRLRGVYHDIVVRVAPDGVARPPAAEAAWVLQEARRRLRVEVRDELRARGLLPDDADFRVLHRSRTETVEALAA